MEDRRAEILSAVFRERGDVVPGSRDPFVKTVSDPEATMKLEPEDLRLPLRLRDRAGLQLTTTEEILAPEIDEVFVGNEVGDLLPREYLADGDFQRHDTRVSAAQPTRSTSKPA